MRLKPSNPASPARPAMMDDTTSGTMIILRACMKRSPRSEQIFSTDLTHVASPNCLRMEATIMAAMSAMMICQWGAIFFIGACYRDVRRCKNLNFTLHFE